MFLVVSQTFGCEFPFVSGETKKKTPVIIYIYCIYTCRYIRGASAAFPRQQNPIAFTFFFIISLFSLSLSLSNSHAKVSDGGIRVNVSSAARPTVRTGSPHPQNASDKLAPVYTNERGCEHCKLTNHRRASGIILTFNIVPKSKFPIACGSLIPVTILVIPRHQS